MLDIMTLKDFDKFLHENSVVDCESVAVTWYEIKALAEFALSILSQSEKLVESMETLCPLCESKGCFGCDG